MSFKPIRLVGVFSALLGASLFVSGVALADSSSSAVSTTNQETKVVLNSNETTAREEKTTSGAGDNSAAASGQSSSNISHSASVSGTSVISSGVEQASDNQAKTAADKTDSGLGLSRDHQPQAASSETLAGVAELQNPITDGSKQTHASVLIQSGNPDGSSSAPLSLETKARINVAIALAAPAQKAVQAQPVISKDSGGVVPVSNNNAPTPAHPTPAPIGGIGQLTAALSKIVVPVSQLAHFESVADGLSGGLRTSLTFMILIITVGLVSSFIALLRLSGFSHGARSDIAPLITLFGPRLNMGLVKVDKLNFPSSFFSAWVAN